MGCGCFEEVKPIPINPINSIINVSGQTGNGKIDDLNKLSTISSINEKPKEIDLTKLNKFRDILIIQDDFFIRNEDGNDFIYQKLKKYEREELEKQFINKCEKFKNDHLSKLELGSIDTNLINSVI